MHYQRKFFNLDGPKALREFFRTHPTWTQQRLADLLGMSVMSVHFWTKGSRRPGPTNLRRALKRIAGIPESAWMTDAEKERARKLRAA